MRVSGVLGRSQGDKDHSLVSISARPLHTRQIQFREEGIILRISTTARSLSGVNEIQ
jgi:hypothetical protein